MLASLHATDVSLGGVAQVWLKPLSVASDKRGADEARVKKDMHLGAIV